MHKPLIVLVFLTFCLLSCQDKEDIKPSLIPFPQEITWGAEKLSFNGIVIDAKGSFENEQKVLEEYFGKEVNNQPITIKLINAGVINPHGFSGAYELRVENEIEIKAPDATGIFYGIQTLKQLINTDGETFNIPKCVINDWPAFQIRGFMHDVGRNYQTPDLLKEQIDVLAAYKYNVFHLHITDDPGWRLESKIYPQLQSAEATSRKPGKFYTQQEFKDLVEYCRQRHITLIPEIDVPGHTAAFRKALGIKSMNSPEVQKIIMDLVDELCTLAPAEIMPYIHLGTDEVREPSELVDEDFLIPIIQKVHDNNREYISWWHGIRTPGDSTSIKQLWAQHEPLAGHPFIDSRANYINHLDPLAGIGRLFFQQPCRVEYGDSLRLGGILCCWPDDRVDEERNILLQNSVYPFMLTYSEAIWRGVKSTGDKYWAQLPPVNSPEYQAYKEFENRLVVHRNKYFQGKEFPFVKNSHIPWKTIGPFNHNGDFEQTFEPEKEIKDSYIIDGKNYQWNEPDLYGGTVHLKHFFRFPSPIQEKEGTVYALNYIFAEKEQEVDFWIGFQNWSRSGGRRGGPTADIGEWHYTKPKIWVNDNEIQPPKWKQPGLGSNTPEIPFVDEDYYYRKPTKIQLQKGWNKFLLKIPQGGNSWKWMFTCVPVDIMETGVREIENLQYSTDVNIQKK
jgi:hypothetical protein